MTRSEIIKFEKIDLKQIAQESHRLQIPPICQAPI